MSGATGTVHSSRKITFGGYVTPEERALAAAEAARLRVQQEEAQAELERLRSEHEREAAARATAAEDAGFGYQHEWVLAVQRAAVRQECAVRLDDATVVLAFVINSNIGKEFDSWHGTISLLAERFGKDRRTTQRHLDRLVEAGFLRRDRDSGQVRFYRRVFPQGRAAAEVDKKVFRETTKASSDLDRATIALRKRVERGQDPAAQVLHLPAIERTDERAEGAAAMSAVKVPAEIDLTEDAPVDGAPAAPAAEKETPYERGVRLNQAAEVFIEEKLARNTNGMSANAADHLYTIATDKVAAPIVKAVRALQDKKYTGERIAEVWFETVQWVEASEAIQEKLEGLDAHEKAAQQVALYATNFVRKARLIQQGHR